MRLEKSTGVEGIWHRIEMALDTLRGVMEHQRSIILVLLLFAHKRLSDLSQSSVNAPNANITQIWKSWSPFELPDTIERISAELNSLFLPEKESSPIAGELFNVQTLTDSVPADQQRKILSLMSGMDLSEGMLPYRDLQEVLQRFSKLLRPGISRFVYQLAGRLLKPQPHQFLLIPFLGYGDPLLWLSDLALGIDFNAETSEVEGWEWDIEAYSISIIYALLLGIKPLSIKRGNYFHFHQPGKIQLDFFDSDRSADRLRRNPDLIFLNPPLTSKRLTNNKIEAYLDGEMFEIPKNRLNLFYLFSALQTLRKDGRMVAVLRHSDLSASGSLRQIWRSVCDRDYIEAIIHLPRGPLTSVASAMVVLNKRKQAYKKHKIVFSKISTRRDDTEETQRIATLIDKFQPVSESDIVARLEEVQQNGYNLLPQYYFAGVSAEIQKITAANIAKRIGDVCEVSRGKFKGTFSSATSGIPYISIKDLSNNVSEPQLDISKVERSKNYSDQEIEKRKSILVALVGRDLKPTIYDAAESRGLLVSPNVAILIPNKDLIDFHYLYYQLHTPLVEKQLEAILSISTAQPSINIATLQEIIIPVPPDVEVQRSIASQQRLLILQAENQRHQAVVERLAGVGRKQEAEFSIVRHLAHNIKPKIQIARSPITALLKFLDDKQLLNEILGKTLHDSDETVVEALSKALLSLNQISDVLESCRNLVVKEIPKNEFAKTDLKSLFEEAIFPAYKNEAFKINFICEIGEPVMIHRESFTEAINNLIQNAKDHAFRDHPSTPELTFRIFEDDEQVIIDYTNNGIRFPAELSCDDFLTFGKKRADSPGDGLGGAWIAKVIEAHDGNFEIIYDQYPLHFRISIPNR